jgi:hypothetical protein
LAWTPVAWALAVLWPPVFATLFVFPPDPADFLADWRLKAMAAAGVGVAAGLFLIGRERARSGTPYTRAGVVMRFFVLGALFTATLIILSAFALALVGAPFGDGVGAFFGALKTTLFVFGIAAAPATLLVGLSYALWAGLIVAFVAFWTKPQSVRVHAGLWEEQPAPE